MKQPTNKTLTAVFAFLFLILLGFGLYSLAGSLVPLVRGLAGEVGSLGLLVCATALLCALVIARGLSRNGREAALGTARSERSVLYERLLRSLAGTGGADRPDAAAQQELERLLLLRAKKSVIDQYLKIRTMRLDPDTPAPALRVALERLVADMRRDLGHADVPFGLGEAVDLLMRESGKGRVPSGNDELRVIRDP